jgi:5-methylcytosine-specific restriction protein A
VPGVDTGKRGVRPTSTISAVRRSSGAAAEIVQQLIPPKYSTKVLTALAHSVRLADQEAPSKWGLRLNRDSIMLKVGFVEMLQLGEGWFRQLVKSDLLPKRMRANKDLKFSNPQYRNAPGCGACDIEDVSMLARVYSALLPAHEEAIRIAARSPRHTTTEKDHSPGLIIFLSQELNTLLPQPAYLEMFNGPAGIPEEISADQEFEEGAAVQVLVNRYERDPAARKQCIQHYGTTCVVCGISLAERYGAEADGLIHVHHLKPLANVGARSIVNPVRDLRPVCPNCHAVIHSAQPARTIEHVRQLLLRQREPR